MIPLSLNLKDTDLSMPLLMEGNYPLRVKAATVVEAKKIPGAYNIKVDFSLDGEASGSKGESIKAGYPFTMYLPWPSELRDEESNNRCKQNLARFQLAILNLKNSKDNLASLPDFTDDFLFDCVDKVVSAKVRTSKQDDNSEYGPKSEIASINAID